MKKIVFAATLAGAALLTSCGGGNGKVQMGSLSEFDSLSYALGANMGFGISYEMKDIPFDYAVVTKAIEEGALNKASQKHDESLEMLRDYFMNKRGTRMACHRREARRGRQHSSGRRRFHEGGVSCSRSRDVRERGGARADLLCIR